MINITASIKPLTPIGKIKDVKLKYGVEFFHIYIDQQIGPEHIKGIEYLKKKSKNWVFDYDLIVLIDNYNPTKKLITTKKILNHLDTNGVMPSFLAFEKDLTKNASYLLDKITNKHLRRSY